MIINFGQVCIDIAKIQKQPQPEQVDVIVPCRQPITLPRQWELFCQLRYDSV